MNTRRRVEFVSVMISRMVLCPVNIDGFSVVVMFRSKAQCAGNGGYITKSCNAVVGHHDNALRVSLSVPMGCVVPFGNGTTITGKVRLAMNTGKLTEPDNIKWTEYQERYKEI